MGGVGRGMEGLIPWERGQTLSKLWCKIFVSSPSTAQAFLILGVNCGRLKPGACGGCVLIPDLWGR